MPGETVSVDSRELPGDESRERGEGCVENPVTREPMEKGERRERLCDKKAGSSYENGEQEKKGFGHNAA